MGVRTEPTEKLVSDPHTQILQVQLDLVTSAVRALLSEAPHGEKLVAALAMAQTAGRQPEGVLRDTADGMFATFLRDLALTKAELEAVAGMRAEAATPKK
jgi:hypothetical protein